MVSIASLHTYPIKSCQGIDLQEAAVGALGIALDRQWVIVDGSFTTVMQREKRMLAAVGVAVSNDGNELVLSAPEGVEGCEEELRVPTEPEAYAAEPRTYEHVMVNDRQKGAFFGCEEGPLKGPAKQMGGFHCGSVIE